MGVGDGLYVYVVVVQKFTFAISSPDEFLYKRSPQNESISTAIKQQQEHVVVTSPQWCEVLRWACRSVCLSVCVSARVFQKSHSKLHETFRACYPAARLGPALTIMDYIMNFRFGFVDDVMFSHSGPYHLAVATWGPFWIPSSQISNVFVTFHHTVCNEAVPFRPYCAGVATRTRNVSEYMLVLALCLFIFVVVHNHSTLLNGGVSDDDTRGAASGWWSAACRIIKAGDEVCCLQCLVVTAEWWTDKYRFKCSHLSGRPMSVYPVFERHIHSMHDVMVVYSFVSYQNMLTRAIRRKFKRGVPALATQPRCIHRVTVT